VANHIPFYLDRSHGAYGRLIGHVSRANPVWRQLAQGAPSVVMFMGPQAYISAAWYPGKTSHGKVVPTWNYVTVHAHGQARAVQDADWLLDMLTHLTDAQERDRPTPWKVTDAPGDYVRSMLQGIVGIELPIDRLEGRLKASQDEDRHDREGTVAGLLAQPDAQAHAVAALVRGALDADGEA
jgi:transcriptional regulator